MCQPVSDSWVIRVRAENCSGSDSRRFLETSKCTRPVQEHNSAASSCNHTTKNRKSGMHEIMKA